MPNDPSPDTTSSASTDLCGQVSECSVPELLARAARQGFTGSLLFKSDGGQRGAIAFAQGHPSRVRIPGGAHGLGRDVLEIQLPPEQIRLAELHAEQHDVDLFLAVKRLVLLPAEVTLRLHREHVVRQLAVLCAWPEATHYRFFPDRDCFAGRPGFSFPIEPLLAVVDCLLSLPSLDRYRACLVRAEPVSLVLVDSLGSLGDSIRGVLRNVVSRLRKEPLTFQELCDCDAAPESALVAALFALLSTGRLEIRAKAKPKQADPPVSWSSPLSSRRSGRSSQAGRRSPRPAGLAHGYSLMARRQFRAALPTTSLSPVGSIPIRGVGDGHQPTRPVSAESAAFALNETELPKSRIRNREVASDERNIEARALQAWMGVVDGSSPMTDAFSVLDEATALLPKNARILFYRGCLLKLAGEFRQARLTLERVIELDPNYHEAQRELQRLSEAAPAQPRESTLLARLTRAKVG